MKRDKIDELVRRNVQSLIDEKGLKPTRWSLDAGLSRTAVADILHKKSRSPGYSTLMLLANAADVDVLRLTVGPNWKQMSHDERQVLDILSRLDEPLRRKLVGYGQGLVDAGD